jgi:hypothetical protein
MFDLSKSKSGRLAVRVMLALAFVLALTPASGALAGFAATLETQSLGGEADMRRVKAFLENKKVSETMAAMGYDQAEIESRLAQLDPSEIHYLAGELETSMVPAGDGGTVLTVVIVIAAAWLIFLLFNVFSGLGYFG